MRVAWLLWLHGAFGQPIPGWKGPARRLWKWVLPACLGWLLLTRTARLNSVRITTRLDCLTFPKKQQSRPCREVGGNDHHVTPQSPTAGLQLAVYGAASHTARNRATYVGQKKGRCKSEVRAQGRSVELVVCSHQGGGRNQRQNVTNGQQQLTGVAHPTLSECRSPRQAWSLLLCCVVPCVLRLRLD